MTAVSQADCRNRLLKVMSSADFEALSPFLAPIEPQKGQILVKAGGMIEHVYFPLGGVASMVAVSPRGLEVEAGLFGQEGFGPVPIVMGSIHSTHQLSMQMPDRVLRIAREHLTRIVEERAALRELLLRFAQVLLVQTAFTALSNAVHTIDERLARWLLMCHDRHASDELPLTHEFLSIMLAVRRPSVTTALHVLEGNQLITAERGYITIRDRRRLEDFAGDAYGTPEAEYRRLIGPMT